MGRIGGHFVILVGLFFLLGAYGAYSEANELQQRHDLVCGGFMEALLDWDGNCDDLRDYISKLEIGAIFLGICGLGLLVSGNNEVNKSKGDKPSKFVNTKLKHYSTGKAIVKARTEIGPSQESHIKNSSFCGNCGTGFPFNSNNKFCTNCGNPR